MEVYESIKKGEHLSPDSRNSLKMKTQQINKLMYLKSLAFCPREYRNWFNIILIVFTLNNKKKLSNIIRQVYYIYFKRPILYEDALSRLPIF